MSIDGTWRVKAQNLVRTLVVWVVHGFLDPYARILESGVKFHTARYTLNILDIGFLLFRSQNEENKVTFISHLPLLPQTRHGQLFRPACLILFKRFKTFEEHETACKIDVGQRNLRIERLWSVEVLNQTTENALIGRRPPVSQTILTTTSDSWSRESNDQAVLIRTKATETESSDTNIGLGCVDATLNYR